MAVQVNLGDGSYGISPEAWKRQQEEMKAYWKRVAEDRAATCRYYYGNGLGPYEDYWTVHSFRRGKK